MRQRWIPLLSLLVLPSIAFSSDQAWACIIVASSGKGWTVSKQMKADVSLSEKQLVISLHDPKNPSIISDTIKGTIEGTEIIKALHTSHGSHEGDYTEYRFPYTGSIEKIGYQSFVGGPTPGGRETIMLKSSVGFIGLTREFLGK